MTTTHSRRARIKNLAAVEAQAFEFVPTGEELPPQEVALNYFGHAHRPGSQRCNALGLQRGDCQQPRLIESIYCYYHDKLASGVMEPTAPVYPVWPLPQRRWRFRSHGVAAA